MTTTTSNTFSNGTAANASASTSNPPVDAALENPAVDASLRSAWERLLQYDKAALKQKNQYVNYRAVILLLGFAASFLSVAFSFNNALTNQFGETFRILLFVLPLMAAGIAAYATQFIPTQLWAKYRFAAETIRREIYLYRMCAGDYLGLRPEQQRHLLLQNLELAETLAEMPVTLFEPPIFNKQEFQELITKELGKDSGDNGFKQLTADDYVKNRLISQYNWYTAKSYKEYRDMRRWQAVGLIIGSVGALLAFLRNGSEVWIAVTTAAAVTIAALANLKIYGRTHLIYHAAARKLRASFDDWNVQTHDERSDRANISEFVAKVEAVFKHEIKNWMEQVQDALEKTDEDIGQATARGGAQAQSLKADMFVAEAETDKDEEADETEAQATDEEQAEDEQTQTSEPGWQAKAGDALPGGDAGAAPEDEKECPPVAPLTVDIMREDQRQPE